MSLHPPYHADSDADDEYERSVVTSPHLQSDSEASSSDSEPPSSANTPKTTGKPEEPRFPSTIITQWTANDTADFVVSLGLPQYCDVLIGERGLFLGVILSCISRPLTVDVWSQRMTWLGRLLSLSNTMS